jgi:hypothetical protein
MGMLILGGFLALAGGMGIGTLAAHLFGFKEVIGQIAGVALVITIGVLLAQAEERDRRAARAPSGLVTSRLAPAPAPMSRLNSTENVFANATLGFESDPETFEAWDAAEPSDAWEADDPSDAWEADDRWLADDEVTPPARTRGLVSGLSD